ncbi:LOW QUALITY PROTEIN: protein ERGIC-53-like [Molossus nigricans]
MSVSGGRESAVPKASTQLLPEPLPGLPARDPPWAQTPDLFTIPVVSGPDPLLCLLLLLLLASHSQKPEGGHPPQKFEYKLSFKGPSLGLEHHSRAIMKHVSCACVCVPRETQDFSGSTPFSPYSPEPAAQPCRTGGLVVLSLSTRTHLVLSVLLQSKTGRGTGKRSPTQRHGVFLNTSRYLDLVCFDVGSLLLTLGSFFGVSAAIRTLEGKSRGTVPNESSWKHILRNTGCGTSHFLTVVSGPRLCLPPRLFVEVEQLHLVQLEGLWARLALGTREDMIPKLSSKDEEGEIIFDLEETLNRHKQILQNLSEHLAQAERQWKQQLGSPGQARPEGTWDSAKVSTLLSGQWTLLQDLLGDTATHMASRAQVFYLPVGIKHHFSELAQILSLLQKDLGPAVRGKKAGGKDPCLHDQPPGAPSCLQPSTFLFFLLIQTVVFSFYLHSGQAKGATEGSRSGEAVVNKQELDESLQDCLSLPLSPAPCILRALGALRRQALSPSMHG